MPCVSLARSHVCLFPESLPSAVCLGPTFRTCAEAELCSARCCPAPPPGPCRLDAHRAPSLPSTALLRLSSFLSLLLVPGSVSPLPTALIPQAPLEIVPAHLIAATCLMATLCPRPTLPAPSLYLTAHVTCAAPASGLISQCPLPCLPSPAGGGISSEGGNH